MATALIDADRFVKAKTFAFGTTAAGGSGLVTINNGTATTSTVVLAVVGSQTIGGNLTVTGNLTVVGSYSEQAVNNLLVTNKDIRVNVGGTTAGAAGAGLTVEGTTGSTIGAIYYDATKAGKFTIGDGTTQNEIVDVSSVQTLTNKIIGGGQITGNITGSAANVTGIVNPANGGSGASTLTGVLIGNGVGAFTTKTNTVGNFVGDTDTQTLTNKTLTAPKIAQINDVTNNLAVTLFNSPASSVNQISNSSSITGIAPAVSVVGADANIALNLLSKGTSSVQANGITITDISTAQTLTNKSISGNQVNSGTLGITVNVPQGGTGLITLTANALLVGAGTSPTTFLLPGTTGNIIVSNGTNWISQAPTVGTSTKRVAVSGTQDGTNATFTLANSVVVGSEDCRIGQVPYVYGTGNNFTVSGTTLTFVVGSQPVSTDIITFMGAY